MSVQASAGKPPLHLGANVFGISFGLAGLAQAWSAASMLTRVPTWPGDVLWILTAAVWLVTVIGYSANVIAGSRWRTQLMDPVHAPFTALAFVVPMMLGVTLAGQARGFGEAVFVVALIGTVLIGGWLTGEWIVADMRLEQWHPGYFLPTTAGGLIAAAGSATLGFRSLAYLMFGYGVICWLLLGSILLLRLFVEPALPVALLPTVAIDFAPPVVAGNAWFAINGGHLDVVALLLAGYALLMLLVQVRLIPAYLRVPFGPGIWAFAFSYAAAFTIAIRWLAAEHVHRQQDWTYVLLAVITAGIGALLVRTGIGLATDTFLPRLPSEEPAVA
jgi:tellurite resistance protein